MKTPSVFQFQDSKSVRVIVIDGEPWFLASDVCAILEHTSPTKAVLRLDEDEKQVIDLSTLNNIQGDNINNLATGNQQANIINESGLYSLILTSRKPEAKKFKKWVTAEVLPAIRKTGKYQHGTPAPEPQDTDTFTHNDMQNLKRIVWMMAHKLNRSDYFTQAVWRLLRKKTGRKAPALFKISDLPIITHELKRLWAMTDLLHEAETSFLKRVVLDEEPINPLLDEINAIFAENLQFFLGTLDQWQLKELDNLKSRHTIHKANRDLYHTASERNISCH